MVRSCWSTSTTLTPLTTILIFQAYHYHAIPVDEMKEVVTVLWIWKGPFKYHNPKYHSIQVIYQESIRQTKSFTETLYAKLHFKIKSTTTCSWYCDIAARMAPSERLTQLMIGDSHNY